MVSDVGGVVEYWVQYGRTTAYGSETAHATVTTQPNVGRAVSDIAIGGLTREVRAASLQSPARRKSVISQHVEMVLQYTIPVA